MNHRKPAVGGIQGTIHVFVLSAFAFAQPVFSKLSPKAEFFTIRRSQPEDIVALAGLLSLGVPLLLACVRASAGMCGGRLQWAVHLSLVGSLTAVALLPAIAMVTFLPGTVSLAVACVLGAASAFGYSRRHEVREFLTVLSPSIALFPALFLFHSPVYRVIAPSAEAEIRRSVVGMAAPVVLVVFDELPTASLLGERGGIDAARYPNFAALARDAHWFPNAVSVAEWTERAVPAILTGRYPMPGRLPTAGDHPDNLFTLLGGTYTVTAYESVTSLCPERLCGATNGSRARERLRSLFFDAGIIYLQSVLPADFSHQLPSIAGTWRNFARAQGGGLAGRRGDDREELFQGFVDSLGTGDGPALFFLHTLLPHHPWVYLPSGRTYDLEGSEGSRPPARWSSDEWEPVEHRRRHLLQVGFADRLLGEVLAKLRRISLYDDALIVVLADHGLSFTPGEPSKAVTKTNAEEVLAVPLLVKRPHQTRGSVIDRTVETIDVLPTIADVLRVDVPWQMDGRSVFDPAPRVGGRSGRTPLEALGPAGPDAWEAKWTGQRWDDVERQALDGVEVQLDSRESYKRVTLGRQCPACLVVGRVRADGISSDRFLVVVGVNGIARAVAVTSDAKAGVATFSAVVPDQAFVEGGNDVRSVAIRRVTASPGEPEPAVTYSLLGNQISASDGRLFTITPGALRGAVERVSRSEQGVMLQGWAADVARSREPEAVVTFIGRTFAGGGTTNVRRPDIVEHFHDPALEWTGFVHRISPSALRMARIGDLHVFVISPQGSASGLVFNQSALDDLGGLLGREARASYTR
jgi:hypothetical protein